MLLHVACLASVNNAAEELEGVSPSDFYPSEKAVNSFKKMLNNRKNVHFQSWQFVMIAIILALLLAFSACMSVPAIRYSVKEVFFKKTEKIRYIRVVFVDDNQTQYDTVLTSRATPTYFPNAADVNEIVISSVTDTDSSMKIQFSAIDDSWDFVLFQGIKNQKILLNEQLFSYQEIVINSAPAVLAKDKSDSTHIIIMFQNDQYFVSVSGHFKDFREAIKVVESIQYN